MDEYGFGAVIQTKADRILQDLPLLKRIHEKAKYVVQMTRTTQDEILCRILEPNVCPTADKVKVLKILHENGMESCIG